ncbi:hypothetical protein B0H13DRAFT_1874597 [Mycena leptocephala]|nr:hypothetical protein B0H13DRAFT_1874597 [Mycena leptocephala]
MSPHPCLRHFKKGISLTTQWTGTERKNMEKVFLGILANATDEKLQLAAAFHDNKEIFVELGIREDFNISKIHKLKHYVDSIRSRGTADGFNTEGTEHLHIDLAKVGYNATNKKAYTRQMTESVHKFGNYLQWAVPGYLAPMSSVDADLEEDDMDPDEDTVHDPNDRPEDSDDERELEDVPSLPAFTVAKNPGYPSLTVASIATDFHAPAFTNNLARFLQSKSIIPRLVPAGNSTFPVYNDLKDTVRAIKASPLQNTPKGVKPAKAGQSDTVLARVSPRRANEGPTDGLCVGRVQVIFRIPEDFGQYPDPVAYIDWYKPLRPPVAGLGMHQVSLSSQNMHQRSSIIPVGDISSAGLWIRDGHPLLSATAL